MNSSFTMKRTVRLTVAFLAGAAMLVVAEGSPVGATTVSPWSVAASPNALATQSNNLNSISCTSSTNCVAVGSYTNGNVGQTLIETWNGSTWAVVSSPNTSPNQGNDLRGVSCATSTNCVAVGSYNNGSVGQTLVETWDGSTWSIVASPNTSSTQLNLLAAVSCTSSTHCVAVGSYFNDTTDQTLIETWNGSNWSIASSPNASSPNGNDLYGVSCPSSTDCVAVGFYHGTTDQALVETWSGSTWTIAPTPTLSPAGDNYLRDVSCTSTTSCVAVGSHHDGTNDQTLVEIWDGANWSQSASPSSSPTEDNYLYGLACTSSTDCVAVGDYSNGPNLRTLVETWNGSTWSIVSSPNTSPTQDSSLADVSCASTTDCLSVGSFSLGIPTQSLVEAWNGSTWSITPSPNVSIPTHNALYGVSCTSATFCMAAGSYLDGSSTQTLVEAWNGSTWSITASPNASTNRDNQLTGISCASPTACVAVGDYSNGSHGQTLVETWDGSAWSLASSPNTSPMQNNQLSGVTCTSPTACVAVGSYFNGTNGQTLVETWNGSTWSITTSPNTSSSQNNQLASISCTSPTACVAVGSYFNGTNSQTLVETWNGSTWSIATSPNTSPLQNNQLASISCTSPTACVAVGDYSNGTTSQTLIEIWNGTTWSISASPNTSSTQDNVLAGVSCTSLTACAGVGHYFNGTDDQTLVVTWDGTTWTMAASANTSTTQTNVVRGVSCASLTACSAVGNNNDGTSNQTLVLNGAAGNLPPIIPAASGYTLAASDGGIFAFGDARFFGSAGALTLNKPIVGMAATPSGRGYWLVASDGGIFSFGDAPFFGSTGSLPLSAPIVGMAATPSGKGYWLVSSSGVIFSFGDAGIFGSAGALTLNKPIVGMATTPSGKGYWLVASDGGIFSYGDASFSGSTGGLTLNKPIVGMAATEGGKGYWLVASDGGIFSYGDAPFLGSAGALTLNKPIVGLAATKGGKGYWLVASDGGIFSYGDASFSGSTGALTLNKPVVGMAVS